MNYFEHESVAKRYANARPDVHPLVIGRVADSFGDDRGLRRALDVGCGTGQSSRALLRLVDRVVGIDIAPEMLREAEPAAGVHYAIASAEQLPFADRSFDLVNVALAFHWFDRDRFLAEAHRVLRPGGWLVIYNDGFHGRMIENPAFAAWNENVYLARFPSPPRRDTPLTDEDAARHGFKFAKREQYSHTIDFTAETLTEYLLTQSNTVAAIEMGSESVDDVRAWLLAELALLFPGETATFEFGGRIWYLERDPAEFWKEMVERRERDLILCDEAAECDRRRDWRGAYALYKQILEPPLPDLSAIYDSGVFDANVVDEFRQKYGRMRAWLWARLGFLHLYYWKNAEALVAFESALREDEDSPDAWLGMASLSLRIWKWRKFPQYLRRESEASRKQQRLRDEESGKR